MAQHVDVHISIEGEQISPFASISITQEINQHHVFEVILPVDAFESTTRDVLQQSKGYIGKPIIIRFGPKLFEKKHPDNQFIGLVTNIGIRRSGHGERQVIMRGYSPTILMDGHGHCRSFTKKSLKDIANAALEKVPRSLDTQLSPQFGGKIPYVVQYNESNWSFLQRMAARYGEWCYYNGTKLVFGKFQKEKSIDLPFGEDLFGFDFALQLMPTHGKAVAYNYLESKVIQGTVATAAVSDLDDFGKFALDQSAKTFSQEPLFAPAALVEQQQELDEILLQLKAATARDMVVATGDSDNPHINVGSTINITGEAVKEQDYGQFIITSIIHNISGTYSYSNGFTAIPAENGSPPAAAVRKPQGDIQPALIVDNADPEGLGRVKAQFYWQQDPETTPWIRVANALAGKSGDAVHGFYFTPEVGDEVMVGFEDNNPDKPFVMGSVYHKKVAPSEWNDKDNHVKVIRTRSGNQIYLIDKDGKEEIKILNAKVGDPTNVISLSMENNGKITIQTKGKLLMKANSIEMIAAETIKVSSGQATNFEAKEIGMVAEEAFKTQAKSTELVSDEDMSVSSGKSTSFTAGTDTSMTAGQELSINSGQATKIEAMELNVAASTNVAIEAGTNVDLTAGANVSVEAGAMAKLKASASLDINSSGITSVKGSLIKLN